MIDSITHFRCLASRLRQIDSESAPYYYVSFIFYAETAVTVDIDPCISFNLLFFF